MILEGLHEKELFSDNLPFRIAENTIESYDYPDHWHNAVELIYAKNIGCTLIVNNVEYILSERDILIVAAGDIHSLHTPEGKGIRFFIQYDFTKLSGFSGTAVAKDYQIHTERISFKDQQMLHEQIEKHIIQIIDEYNNKKPSYDLLLNARLLDITVILSRNPSKHIKTPEEINKVYELSKLDKAFKYIEENFQKQITLKDAANATGFSEYHFSRIFKKATEKNFIDYLNEYRIKKVETLLFDSSITITDAAYASGFSSLSTFNRVFKRIKGCTPSAYIKILI